MLNINHEYLTTVPFQKTLRKATKMYLTLADKVALMTECGDAAMILYEFYISKAGVAGYTYADATVSFALKWSTSKVKKNRLRLIKAGYFKQVSGKLSDNRLITHTYLDPAIIQDLPNTTVMRKTLPIANVNSLEE